MMKLIWGAVGIAIILGIGYFINEDRLAKQKIEQARWAPIQQCADEFVFSRIRDKKYVPEDWNRVLEEMEDADFEMALATRMQKRCDGLQLLPGDTEKIIATARSMIEERPVSARSLCGCAVSTLHAWALRVTCIDLHAFATWLRVYRLDNYMYPTNEQGLEALVSPSELEPEPRNFKEGGYMSEVPTDQWGNPYVYKDGEVRAWVPNGYVSSAASLLDSEGVMRAMEAEGCF